MDLKYLRHVIFYFVTAVLSLILVYYACYHLFDGFAQTITTVVTERVTQNQTITLDGYLMRDEQYVYASRDEEVGYLYGDGEKVAENKEIARVYSVSNPGIRSKILALDQKIALFERSNAVIGVTASDTSVIDRQIARLYLILKNALNTGDAEYVYRKQNELLVLLNQRKIITQNVDSYDRQISQLKTEKNALIASLGGETETVRADVSGFFYSALDGYETVFDSDLIDSLTVQRFEQMIKAEPDIDEGSTPSGYRIGKIVTDYNWQVACIVNREQGRFFKEGSEYSVVFPFNGDAEIVMRLIRAQNDMEKGKTLLVFETGENPDQFNFLRMQTINIVQKTYDGYRVPISAVRLADGVEGVYILQGSYVRFRAIKPLYEDDGYLIAAADGLPIRADGKAWLELYDNIIVEGKDLYDGKIVR